MSLKNKYKCKPYAAYSLQFWFDKYSTNLLETYNAKKGKELKDITEFDLKTFAYEIANSKLLDLEDKKQFSIFCKSYLKYIKELNKKK